MNTEDEMQIKEILSKIHDWLSDNEDNAYNQIVEFLLSGEIAYIPNDNKLRCLIKKYDRDVILTYMLKNFIK